MRCHSQNCGSFKCVRLMGVPLGSIVPPGESPAPPALRGCVREEQAFVRRQRQAEGAGGAQEHVRLNAKLMRAGRATVETIKKKAPKISSAILNAQEAVPNAQGRF